MFVQQEKNGILQDIFYTKCYLYVVLLISYSSFNVVKSSIKFESPSLNDVFQFY